MYVAPTYTWDENICVATRYCAKNRKHREVEVVYAEYVKDYDATCVEREQGHYLASFHNPAFGTITKPFIHGEKLQHTRTKGYCDICEATELSMELSEDGQFYSVFRGRFLDLEEVLIPTSYRGLPVKEIYESAFYGNTYLKRIEIPEGITSVGRAAFKDCDALQEVIVSSTVKTIREETFDNCKKLTTVTLQEGVEKIEERAFFGCFDLENVSLPNSLIEIGVNAFESHSELKYNIKGNGKYLGNQENPYLYLCDVSGFSITIDEKCRFINIKNISLFSNVNEIAVENNNTAFQVIDGNLYSKDGKTFIVYASNATMFAIPSGVTKIGDYAFGGYNSLVSIEIPNTVTSIGKEAFSYCPELQYVVIPLSVEEVKPYAFSDYACVVYCEAESQPSGWDKDWLAGYYPCWYRANKPTEEGYFWHYVNGVPTKW